MNIKTGEIVDQDIVDMMPQKERLDYVSLTNQEAEKLKPMKKKGRAQWYRDQQAHQKKKLKKRRDANKRNRKHL